MITWEEAENMPFQGWDFSFTKGEMIEEEIPWSYKEEIMKRLKKTDVILDMGTGGGEFLLGLNHPYNKTTVTEGYAPNVKFCKEQLSPLGINVVEVTEDSSLNLESDYFDIVINRHESYDPREIYRILKPKGVFITQQVGGKDMLDLSYYLIPNFSPEYFHLALEKSEDELKNIGFITLKKEEKIGLTKFMDIRKLIYFAKQIPWSFPEFSAKKSRKKLKTLDSEIKKSGYIQVLQHRYILIARK